MDRTDLLYRRVIDDVLVKTKKEFESYGWEEDVVNHRITLLQRLWEQELTKHNSIPKPNSLRKQLSGPGGGARGIYSSDLKRAAPADLSLDADPAKRQRLPYQSLTSSTPTLSLAASQQLAYRAQQVATYGIPPNPYDPSPSMYMPAPSSSPAAHLPPLPPLSQTHPIPTPANTVTTMPTTQPTSTSTATSSSTTAPASTPTTIPQRDGGDDDDIWEPQTPAAAHESKTTTSSSTAPTASASRRRDDLLDREELGPEDDDEEDTAPNPTDLILCQYEKVSHGKNNHWKVQLKHGIMKVDGREYVFGKGTAEWDW